MSTKRRIPRHYSVQDVPSQMRKRNRLERRKSTGDCPAWVLTQMKTFTNWVNDRLKDTDYRVDDLQDDLDDGLTLLKLVENLAPEKRLPRYNRNPKMDIQRMENLEIAFRFLEREEKMSLIGIGAADIMHHNLKLILGLLWQLILHYHLGVRDRSKGMSSSSGGSSSGGAKGTLLAWVQAVIPLAGVRDFTTSWNDGRTLSALVDRMKPGLIPNHWDLSPKDALKNTRRAMDLAEQYFSIPQVLHPEDLCTSSPEELSVITYISYFCGQDSPGQHLLMEWIHSKIPQCAVSNFTSDWTDGITLGCLIDAICRGGFSKYKEMDPQNSLQNLQAAMDFAEANLEIPKIITAEQIASPEPDPIQIMSYLAYFESFKPTEETLPSPNTTVHASTCRIEELPSGFLRVGKEYSFSIIASDIGSGVLEASGQGASMPLKVEARPKDESGYVVSFTPSEVGDVEISLMLNGATILGSPVRLKVNDPTGCMLISASLQSKYRRKESVDLMVSTADAGGGKIKARVAAPESNKQEIAVREIGESTQMFLVQFVPVKSGQHSIDITYDGDQIPGAPVCFLVDEQVSEAESVVTEQPSPGKYGAFIVNTKYHYKVNATEACEGELEASAFGKSSGSEAELEVADHGNQQYTIGIKATVPDEYVVNIKWGEDGVPGSPFDITFEDEPDPSRVQVVDPHRGSACEPVVLVCNTASAGAGVLTASCHGKKSGLIPVELQEKEKHIFHVTFEPPQEDVYTIAVLFNKESVPGSPFSIDLTPSDPTKVAVTEPRNIEVSRSSVFIVDASEAGPGELTAFCRGSSSTLLLVSIRKKNALLNQYEVEVTPSKPERYSLQIKWDNTEVPGSPFEIDLLPHIFPDRVQVTVPIEMPLANPYCIVDCTSAGQGNVTASCTSDRNGIIDPVKIEGTETEGIYMVSFTPRGTDNYHLSVSFDGVNVPGSPFAIPLLCGKARSDPSQCTVENVPCGRLRVGKTYNLVVVTDEAGDGKLEAFGCGTSLPVKYEASPTDSSFWTIGYTPYEVGFQALAITFNGSPIPDSPLKFNVVDPTKCHYNAGALVNGHYKAKQRVSFLVSTQSCGRGEFCAKLLGASGEEEVFVSEQGDSVYLVQFTPAHEGEHFIDLTFDGDEIPDSPAQFFVSKPGSASSEVVVIEPSLMEDGVFLVEQPVVYTLDATGANEAELTASGYGVRTGSQPHLAIINHEQRLFSLKVKATIPDDYSISIKWGEDEVPGSPFGISFAAKPSAKLVRVERPQWTNVSEPVHFKCDTRQAGKGKISATCCGKRVGFVPVDVQTVQNQKFFVAFTPPLEDMYTINVLFAENHVPGSPFKVNLVPTDASKVVVTKPNQFQVNCQSVFQVDATEAGAGELTALLQGENAESLPVTILKRDDNIDFYDVQITPKSEDRFHLFIFWNDMEVPRSPFEVDLLPRFFPDRVQVQVVQEEAGTNPYCLVDTSNAGSGRITTICTSDKYGTVDSVVIASREKSTEHRVSFTPLGAGDYHMTIMYGYKPVPGSPFLLEVRPAMHAVEEAEPDATKVEVDGPHSKPMVFVSLDTSKAGHGKVTAECHGTKDNSVPVEIEQAKEGGYKIMFLPLAKDVYTLSICYGEEPIKGSPFIVNLLPIKFSIDNEGHFTSLDHPTAVSPGAGKSRTMSVSGQFAPENATGPEIEGLLPRTFRFGQPCRFNISTKGAGPGSLSVISQGPAKAEVLTSKITDDTYSCTIVPSVPGKYLVDILWNNSHIPGSPYKLRFQEKVKRSIFGFDIGEDFKVGVPVSFRLYTTDLGAGSLNIACLPETGADIRVKRVLEDKYAIEIVPKAIGPHTIRITYNGRNLLGSPMNVIFNE